MTNAPHPGNLLAVQPLASESWLKGERNPHARNSQIIGPLAKLNVFVGPNNSGKSRALRSLAWDLPTMPWVSDAGPFSKLFDNLSERRDFQQLLGAPSVRGAYEGNALHRAALFFDANVLGALQRLVNGSFSHSDKHHAAASFMSELSNTKRAAGTPYRRVYIPVLRALRPVPAQAPTERAADSPSRTFRDRAVLDYPSLGKVEGGTNAVFTGDDLYHRFQRMRLGSPTDREQLDKYERFLSKWFFEDKHVYLTARIDGRNDVLHIGVEGIGEFPIFGVGDGLSQLILGTFPLFQHPDEHVLLFMEEPENSLHPGLQRRLAEAWLHDDEYAAPNRQVFITTHSTAFLDMTLDHRRISVFRVRQDVSTRSDGKGPDVQVSIASSADRQLLAELGMASSMIFLSNCTVWIEGPTDRVYFQHYLSLLQKQREEAALAKGVVPPKPLLQNLHFSFFPYSGNGITQWSFLEEKGIDATRLCSDMFLIADRDDAKPGSAKAERHQKLADTLKQRFYLLNVREVENLLTVDVLLKVIKARDPHLSGVTIDPKRVASAKLGELLQSSVDALGANANNHKYCTANGGNVWNKAELAMRACDCMSSFDDLSEEAQALTHRIDAFIRDHNTSLAFVEK